MFIRTSVTSLRGRERDGWREGEGGREGEGEREREGEGC